MEALNYSKTLRRVSDIDAKDYYDHLKMAVLRSQRCQRNYDLSKTISEEQKELLLFAATNCPTKQNNEYYSVVVTENRDIIESIHEETLTSGNSSPTGEARTNPQVLGQLLIAFVEHKITEPKNIEQEKIFLGTATEQELSYYRSDAVQAIGVAAGHVSMMAALLGLESGCCKCMNAQAVKNILTIKQVPKLLMGIGYRDLSRNRRVHHITNQKIGSFSKNIKVIQR